MQKFPTEDLKGWFVAERRVLPWRENPTPYRVWISEVMLQQTQVAVVIPYFERWMEAFPTIAGLAQAPVESVLKCWEGLGYYSRARNLHKGAKQVLEKFGGELPSAAEDLASIAGIGPYTVGAIRSFAFKQKAAAVDGNVLRVLSRFLGCEDEIDAPQVKKRLQGYLEGVLPDKEPWLVSEGLIELGALVCGKKAKCGECPLSNECLALRHGLQDVLPRKRARPETIELIRHVAVVTCKGRYLVQKGAKGKVMADLYEFPFIEGEGNEIVDEFERHLGLKLGYVQPLPGHTHTFTRYRARLFPHLLHVEGKVEGENWKSLEELHRLPFSAGHKRILRDLTT